MVLGGFLVKKGMLATNRTTSRFMCVLSLGMEVAESSPAGDPQEKFKAELRSCCLVRVPVWEVGLLVLLPCG